MVDKNEALKLALEALEFIPESGSMLGAHAEAKRLEAITAIKEALAQPEQEPVAFMREDEDCTDCIVFVWERTEEHTIPLYTTPPQRKPEQESDDLTIAYMSGVFDGKNKDAPRREWVGLTRDEVLDIEETETHPLAFYRAIEAKLREKNT